MIRHQRTVVALSASDADRALVAYARMLAGMRLARHFDFVHVRTPARIVDEQRSDAEVLAATEKLVAEQFGGGDSRESVDASASCQVLSGVRVDALLEFIAAKRADMALLGHRRNRSGQRSLARRLAMIAPCSVWLVPDGAPVSITSVMAPVDFSDHSADSVGVAASIAKAAGLAECVATHVFADPLTIRYDEHVDELRRNEQESFDRFVAPIDRHGVAVEPLFVEGNNVARTLLHTASRQGTDLLVMNTRGRSRSASILLGSVTTQVMVETPIAVLAVKHFGAMMNLFEALKQSHLWSRANPKTN